MNERPTQPRPSSREKKNPRYTAVTTAATITSCPTLLPSLHDGEEPQDSVDDSGDADGPAGSLVEPARDELDGLDVEELAPLWFVLEDALEHGLRLGRSVVELDDLLDLV